MNTPLISMIVPTYNQAEYLGPCLDSIWFQDYPNIEIVVVSDCSPDHTRQVLEEFQQATAMEHVSYASNFNESTNEIERTFHKRYPDKGRKLVVQHNPKKMGSTPAYNQGFQIATGDFCTYIASDDICHPQMVSELSRPLISGEADFTYSDLFIIDDDMRIMRQFNFPDYSFEACFLNWYLLGVSKLYRRSLHDRFGWYDENYLANDHEFYQRIALGGARLQHVPKVLYSIRSHDQPKRTRHKDVHSASNWTKLLDEERSLVRLAREAWADGMGPMKGKGAKER